MKRNIEVTEMDTESEQKRARANETFSLNDQIDLFIKQLQMQSEQIEIELKQLREVRAKSDCYFRPLQEITAMEFVA